MGFRPGSLVLSQGPLSGWQQYKNLYAGDNGIECSIHETLVAHPFLGWVFGPFEPCRRFPANNSGFWDRRAMPKARDPNYFTILITGGSVATSFAYGTIRDTGYRIWLEDILNRDFSSPNGKPLHIIVGAMPMWSMPAQNIAVMLFGHLVDGVIAIDGYNEALSAQALQPLDRPSDLALFAAQNPFRAHLTFVLLRVLRDYQRFILSSPILRHSQLALLVFEKVLARVMTDPNSGTTRLYQPKIPDEFFSPKSCPPIKGINGTQKDGNIICGSYADRSRPWVCTMLILSDQSQKWRRF